MDAPVQLVFFGEVLEGFRLDEVKLRVGQLLKLDDAKLAQLFSGSRTVLKRSVAQIEAQRYASVLAKAGARIHIEPSAAAVAKPAAAPAPAKAASTGFPTIEASAMDVPVKPVAAAPVHVPKIVPAAAAATAMGATPARATSLELAPLAAVVEDEVTCPNCGERQTKRLLCRGCSTNIEMGIAAKLEAENEARMAKNDAILAQRAMRASRQTNTAVSSPGTFGFSLSGRMARLKYATSNVWMLTVLYFLAILVLQRPSIGRVAFALLGLAIVGYMSLRLSVLRCHDCNKTGWWALLTFIPSVNAIFGLVLSFAPGTRAENDYGEEPPSSSWWFLLLAVVCLILGLTLTMKSALRMAERSVGEQQEEETSDLVEFDSRSNSLPTPEAREAFNGPYTSAREHKAFAISKGGGWGMSTSAGSPRDAIQAAMADCEARRPQYTPRCVPVNLDGQWGPAKER